MATKTNKISKPAAVSPVAAFVAGMLTLCTEGAAAQSVYGAAKTSRSATAVALIAGLYASFKGDAKGYTAAIEEAFGNGVKGKGNTAGAIKEALKASKVESSDVRDLLSRARMVAANWSRPDVRKAASESGIRAGYDAAKPTAKAESAAPVAAKPVSRAEVIAAILREEGIGTLLAMVESACVAMKDTIRANIVHDARVKVG